MIFVEEPGTGKHASHASTEVWVEITRQAGTEITTESWMTVKNKFQQQRLWTLPIERDGGELPATRRQELMAALADLLWQFARVSAEVETTGEQGGSDGHDEPDQNHA